MTEPTEQEVEDLIGTLRSFGKAYPLDMFGPVTDAERNAHGSLISRNSAAMGRHLSKFMVQAADMIESLSSRLAAAELELAASRVIRENSVNTIADLHRRLAAERKDAERQYRLGAEAMLECRELMERTLQGAPGLPLSHCTPAELETWTDAITTVLMNLGLARVAMNTVDAAIAESTK